MCDQKVADTMPGRSGGRIFFSRINFLLIYCYKEHPFSTLFTRSTRVDVLSKFRKRINALH